jgi:riboflavin synthase
MFSGIVESKSQIISTRGNGQLVFIEVTKPEEFNDLSIGDSIATNGVCLTVEAYTDKTISFALGAETLAITGWNEKNLNGREINLERSLRMGDRIHGHMVSGHVDTVGEVVGIRDDGGSVLLDVKAPESILRYVWKKGSWAVNGVSLTINSVENGVVGHCLIPETVRRTNLGALKIGDKVNLEIDMMARGMIAFLENAPAMKELTK